MKKVEGIYVLAMWWPGVKGSMSSRINSYAIFGTGAALLGLGMLFERVGVFLYFGYTLVALVGSLAAVVLLAWSVLAKSQGSLSVYVSATMAVSLISAAWAVRYLDSGPRKHFYLLSTHITPGESLNSVRERLRQYESWQASEGYLSFRCVSGPGTADVVIVHYDRRTAKVLDTQNDLD